MKFCKILPLLLFFIALFPALYCDNSGLYELATYDPILVFAITDDGISTNTIIVTDGKYYTREYVSTGPYFTPTKLYVNRKAYLLASSAGGFYLSRKGYSNWEGPISFPPLGTYSYSGGSDDSFYAITNSAGTYYMYRLDLDTLTWVDQTDISSSATGTARWAREYRGEFLMVTEYQPSDYYYIVYSINNMSLSEIAYLYYGAAQFNIPFIHLSRHNDVIYMGCATGFYQSYYGALQSVGSGITNAISFAVTENSEKVYISNTDLSLSDGSSFTTIYSFPGSSGAFIEPMSGSIVAVGSNGSSGSAGNGLLLFDLSTQTLMTQVTSQDVKGMCTFRRNN